MNDYYLSNIIIDYHLKDVPTNALKNVRAMMAYNKENHFLSEKDKDMYDFIQNIDTFDSAHKLMLFKIMNEQNIEWTEKFYDDFTMARDAMVAQINDSLLTKDNMSELYDETLSKQAEVPIYCLRGQKYKVLVRNIGVGKNQLLTDENLGFIIDGSSFSVDGSEMVDVFGSIDKEYVLAYSKIPDKQLIHSFFGDSFTRYERDENDVPLNKDSSERIVEFYTPEQLTSKGVGYNELLISVPNIRRKNNEFEERLERTEAFAIYCYDEIKPADIESAKKLGLSIIMVDTKAYNLDRSGRASTLDEDPWNNKKLQYISSSRDMDER